MSVIRSDKTTGRLRDVNIGSGLACVDLGRGFWRHLGTSVFLVVAVKRLVGAIALTKLPFPQNVMVLYPEADDARNQGGPGIQDHAEAVRTHPQPTQPLEPADRPLDHPPDLAQPAAVLGISSGDMRLNVQPTQEDLQRLAVVAPVCMSLIGQLLEPTRCPAHLGKVQDHR